MIAPKSDLVKGMFVYHLKPENISGTKLYPLSAMEELLPETYARGSDKYIGREKLMEKRLASLGCRWNDVIHLSPISPALIWDGYMRAGGLWKRTLEWFKIPVESLADMPVAWYFSPPRDQNISHNKSEIPIEYCPLFNWKEYKEIGELPKDTIAYYKQTIDEGRGTLLFVGIPHVLVRGSIETINCLLECRNP